MEHLQEEQRPYTPAEILDYFIRNDKPLPGEVIQREFIGPDRLFWKSSIKKCAGIV